MLQETIALYSPATVMIDGASLEFLFYKGGIYSNSKCNSKTPNVAMLAVGYGSENGHDFWTLKSNSGQDWGEQGYMRLARNANNMCGVATIANFPYVKLV